MIFRTAVDADVQELSELRFLFWQSQHAAGMRDGRNLERARLLEETAKMLTRPRSALMVAEGSSALIGYCFGTQIVAPNLNPACVRSIEEVFIGTKHLNAGSGRALVAATLDAIGPPNARTQIRVLWENDAGRRFWEKLGFEPAVLIMEREIK